MVSLAGTGSNASKTPIKLYWWRYLFPDKLNFGDEITPILIEQLFGRKVIWAPPSECDMAGVGSIIEVVQNESNSHQVAVWGSGFIKAGPRNRYDNIQFCAVRGHNSLERASDRPDVSVGDPGLLLPLAIKARPKNKKHIGILPHYVDYDLPIVRELASDRRVKIINALDSVETVINEIAGCDAILSSSLHGLIVADAYGIPNGRLVCPIT